MEEPENTTGPIKNGMPNVTENAGEPPRKRQDTHELQSDSALIPADDDDRKNPLLNSVVLQHLFQLCPASILEPCRLACKLWYDESLIPWRTIVPNTITMKDKDILFGTGFCSFDDRLDSRREDQRRSPTPPAPQMNQTSLKEFFEFIDNPEYKYKTRPHRNIEFDECNFEQNPGDFGLIWKAIGSNITTMCLYDCTFSSVDEFRQIIYKHCPILKKLKICGCLLQSGTTPIEAETDEYKGPVYGEHKHLTSLSVDLDVIHSISVSWLELFSHYTSLTSFELNETANIPEHLLKKLIKAIQTIRQMDNKKLQFKHFDFPYKLGISRDPAAPFHFSLAEEVGLPLDRCDTTDIRLHQELDLCFLARALRYLAPTLTTMRIKSEKGTQYRDAVPTWFTDFPFGIQLDKLCHIEWTCDRLENFTFLKFVPNIDALNIYDSERRRERNRTVRRITNAEKEELADLKMLRLNDFAFEFKVDDEDVQQFCDWMPNMTDLKMILSPNQTTKFIQNCKNLQWVTVLGGKLEEKGPFNITMAEGRQIGIRNRRFAGKSNS